MSVANGFSVPLFLNRGNDKVTGDECYSKGNWFLQAGKTITTELLSV